MIQLSGIFKTFRSGRGMVAALKDISFSVEKGNSLILAGKSGSGKTTLLNCIGGLEKPEKGRVVCAGEEIHSLSGKALSRFQRTRIGFVFQSGNLVSYLNVRENIEFPMALNEIAGERRKRRVAELLDAVGLGGAGSAMPFELSAGETQRVAFARAIIHSPSILLADEPTANLDSENGRQLINLMFSLSRESGCTMVVATHDAEIIHSAPHKILLKDGQIEDAI
ncbi:MAG: ABC transporter ATP-binding protein [Desulfosalsimonadaceae bacterium]